MPYWYSWQLHIEAASMRAVFGREDLNIQTEFSQSCSSWSAYPQQDLHSEASQSSALLEEHML